MRVLQLIDSLRPGGAEKMAVNIANALRPHVGESFICCTRQEGMLKDEIKPEVGYLFLNKKRSLDPKALLKLIKYIQKNKIDIVHAHSTSYFLAGLLKLAGGRFKLVWHDHYGESETLDKRKFKVLKKLSRLFDGIISVNTALKDWAMQNLKCPNVTEIKNFIPEPHPPLKAKIKLKGAATDFKIICVANLRPQKDHFNLLKAFENLGPDKSISLHLIGENPGTPYSNSVLKSIYYSPVSHKIFYYGEQPEIVNYLKKCDIGIIPSRSEGLPLALLEYGMAGLPVISTNVGKCSEIIGENGIVIPSEDPDALTTAIEEYFFKTKRRRFDGKNFQLKIKKEYSEIFVISTILVFYKKTVANY